VQCNNGNSECDSGAQNLRTFAASLACSRHFRVGELSAVSAAEGTVIQSFRDLEVWRRAMTLAEHMYVATEALPRAETYGLTSQMRRAAVSIPSNIAEGKAIGGRSYRKHLRIALGSEAELQTQVELAVRLKMLDGDEASKLLSETSEVGRMLTALLKSLLRAKNLTP
jgi:four helix bundle protein